MDRQAIRELGFPGMVLMERAGLQVLHQALALLGDARGPVCVLCGKGNNGGDGFVIARELHMRGLAVSVLVCAEIGELTGDAAANRDIATRLDVPILYQPGIRAVRSALQSSALVIDALLGTGITGAVRPPLTKIIDAVNDSAVPVVSVDIPSGLPSDTGQPQGPCIRATATVTLAAYKRGLLLQPGRELAGALTVAEIGIPPAVLDNPDIPIQLTELQDVAAMLPLLSPTRHKSSAGKLLIIAGSRGMTGAATLSGQAAMRVGTGLTIVAAPESCHNVLEEKLTEVMTLPLPETEDGTLDIFAVDALGEQLAWADTVAIGPGLGRNPRTQQVVIDLIQRTDLPLVIDADALFALAEHRKKLPTLPAHTILTPHEGEFARLMGCAAKDVAADRIGMALSGAEKLGATVLLKGAPTIVATPNGRAFINPTGNPGLATGGSGDVLTGVIGGLLAQGAPTVEAGITGACVHGLAGDLAADDAGERGMTAGDVVEFLPDALRALETT